MLDFLGQEIHVGDQAVYLVHYKTSSHLVCETVTGITPQKVRFPSTTKKPEMVVVIPSSMWVKDEDCADYAYCERCHHTIDLGTYLNKQAPPFCEFCGANMR